jgi:hypothetical protein
VPEYVAVLAKWCPKESSRMVATQYRYDAFGAATARQRLFPDGPDPHVSRLAVRCRTRTLACKSRGCDGVSKPDVGKSADAARQECPTSSRPILVRYADQGATLETVDCGSATLALRVQLLHAAGGECWLATRFRNSLAHSCPLLGWKRYHDGSPAAPCLILLPPLRRRPPACACCHGWWPSRSLWNRSIPPF